MSLYSALYSGVSGLGAYSSALSAISDNITNINTVGYKNTITEFSTLVTETSSFSSYSAGGVQGNSRTLISRQGLLQASASPTDLSIDGAGFFIVNNAPSANAEGSINFTRAGSFRPDSEGFLRNTSGMYLLGFPLDSTGQFNNTGNVNDLRPIQVSELTGTAEATENFRLRANVNAEDPLRPEAVAGTYSAAASASNMASGAVEPNFRRDYSVYDSQGGQHTMRMSFLKTSTPNRWDVEIHAVPATDINTAPGLVDGQIAVGQVAFNGDGSIDLTNTSAAFKAPLSIAWTNGTNVSLINLDIGTDGANDGLTQNASISTEISSSIDGAQFGNVVGVSINREGTVTTLFDNGLTQDIFQLPMATFQNPDGLTRAQGNAYSVSDFSGRFSLVTPGSGGGGSISPSTLEASTVDLANEFTGLITTQRAFSASTKVITTVDEMLNELNSVRR